MRKIQEYVLIRRTLGREVEEAVELHLRNGWELYGTPFYTASSYCQAMIRYAEEKSKSGTVPFIG